MCQIMLSRLETFNCPLITASKLVSLLLILPKIAFIASEKLPSAFESSALFESGQKYQLTNFEHSVSHLERAREKFNHHLNQSDTFLIKVSEIFPRILTVKLTLSYFIDSYIISQMRCFDNLHTLILELPDGRMEENFQVKVQSHEQYLHAIFAFLCLLMGRKLFVSNICTI